MLSVFFFFFVFFFFCFFFSMFFFSLLRCPASNNPSSENLSETSRDESRCRTESCGRRPGSAKPPSQFQFSDPSVRPLPAQLPARPAHWHSVSPESNTPESPALPAKQRILPRSKKISCRVDDTAHGADCKRELRS